MTDPRVPAAFRPARVEPATDAGRDDPLRFCVATTVAVIAWLVTPPLAVTLFGALGTRAYLGAYRAGRMRSRCLLGDVRWVLLYLTVLTVAGGAVTAVRVADWLR